VGVAGAAADVSLPPPSSTNLARALSSKQRTVVVVPPKPSTLAPHLDPGPSNQQLLRKRGYGSRYDSDRKSSASDERRRDTTEQDPADRAIASGATDQHVDIVRAQGSQ
jgi:hypothetical protein